MLLMCFSSHCLKAQVVIDQSTYSKELKKAIQSGAQKYLRSLDVKDRDKAVSLFEDIIKNNPEEAGVCYMYLSEIYRAQLADNKEDQEIYYNYLLKADELLSINDKYPSQKYNIKYNLGLCYYYGYHVAKDYDKAYAYFEEAYGYEKRYGVSLAEIYLFGYGRDIDYKKAIMFYKEAMIAGNPSVSWVHFFELMYMIDQAYLNVLNKDAYDCYSRARSLTYNTKEGMENLKKSAEMGYAPAMFELGTFFYSQPTAEFTQEVAENWIYKAYELEYAPAIYNMGAFTLTKCKNPSKLNPNYYKYYKEGKELFEKSADAGFPQGQYTIGQWYYLGIDGIVERDLKKAYYYLSLGADGLNAYAIALRDDLLKRLDASVIAEVDAQLANNRLSNAMIRLDNAIAKLDEIQKRSSSANTEAQGIIKEESVDVDFQQEYDRLAALVESAITAYKSDVERGAPEVILNRRLSQISANQSKMKQLYADSVNSGKEITRTERQIELECADPKAL